MLGDQVAEPWSSWHQLATGLLLALVVHAATIKGADVAPLVGEPRSLGHACTTTNGATPMPSALPRCSPDRVAALSLLAAAAARNEEEMKLGLGFSENPCFVPFQANKDH